MYILIKFSDNYSKTFEGLSKYFNDEPNDDLADSEPYKPKIKITESTPADGNEKKC